MNDEACIITINNTDYYYPCDRRADIIISDNSIINTSSSTITLYHDFPEYGDNYSGYPRIYLPSNTIGYYRSSYGGNSSSLVVNSYEFKSSSFSLDFYLMIVLIGVLVINLFKR